jgi:hypothetical protein
MLPHIAPKELLCSLFWGEIHETPRRVGFALGLHDLEPGFAWFQTQDKPAKVDFYFLTLFISMNIRAS